MASVRNLPGYDGKYKISTEGHVWRKTDDGELVALSVHDNRVYLFQNGEQWRPRLWTLVERTFGEDAFDDPSELTAVDL